MVEVSFEQWLAQVDRYIVYRLNLSVTDLPGCPFRAWYESGVSPRQAIPLVFDFVGVDPNLAALFE